MDYDMWKILILKNTIPMAHHCGAWVNDWGINVVIT